MVSESDQSMGSQELREFLNVGRMSFLEAHKHLLCERCHLSIWLRHPAIEIQGHIFDHPYSGPITDFGIPLDACHDCDSGRFYVAWNSYGTGYKLTMHKTTDQDVWGAQFLVKVYIPMNGSFLRFVDIREDRVIYVDEVEVGPQANGTRVMSADLSLQTLRVEHGVDYRQIEVAMSAIGGESETGDMNASARTTGTHQGPPAVETVLNSVSTEPDGDSDRMLVDESQRDAFDVDCTVLPEYPSTGWIPNFGGS
jgi:hypothetical protein